MNVGLDATSGNLSPDGTSLLFTARDAKRKTSIWIRPIDSLSARALEGTDDASFPFWSYDGQAIAFFARGTLKRRDIAGGATRDLCDAPNGRGGTWNQNGVIVAALSNTTGLSRVPATEESPFQPLP